MENDVLYIVMPAYNEEANIENAVTQWYAIIASINGQGAAKSKFLIANGKWFPITFKPRQGGVNSINIKRIFQIGRKALRDFKSINKQLQKLL